MRPRVERRLVERAMHGDEEAFDALIERIGTSLFSVARRILRDPSLAEDATQAALLRAWRHLPQLRDPDQFEAWAYRLLVNSCFAEARRERRHRGNLRLITTDHPVVPDAAASVAAHDALDRAFRQLSVEAGMGRRCHVPRVARAARSVSVRLPTSPR